MNESNDTLCGSENEREETDTPSSLIQYIATDPTRRDSPQVMRIQATQLDHTKEQTGIERKAWYLVTYSVDLKAM